MEDKIHEFETKEIPERFAEIYRSSYPNFGWEIRTLPADGKQKEDKRGYISLYFQRDKSLCNKMELTRLQHHFDSCMVDIDRLEKGAAVPGKIVAGITAVLGMFFLSASVISALMPHPHYLASVLLAIPGLIFWIMSFLLYRFILQNRTRDAQTIISERMDTIQKLCREGRALLF